MTRPATGGSVPPGRSTRRRGDDLEQAILDAVFAEVTEHGYTRLTMEGVAARARTSKPVLYRRWPTKAELVIAVLGRGLPTGDEQPPDTGTLRSDLVTVLLRVVHRFDGLPGEAVHGFLLDVLRDPELRRRLWSGIVPDGPVDTLAFLMGRAAERGEINGDRLNPRVTALPLSLLRDEFLIHGGPPDDRAIEEIVDDVVLPLLRGR
ncbi:TetR/AcrR family transcriptional regulator [Kitasatospora sp. HPMI-4]|uniref:TetR/AcrR family transcriptional regulator n=1 Tax=Kitasatospora sp. HPMI-4 TaxID=3448443 RepID=UPI003F1E3EE0